MATEIGDSYIIARNITFTGGYNAAIRTYKLHERLINSMELRPF
jgi:hypothetical protein